jgi:MerR family redox-sensitive transcriptional activator SoxR
MDALSIGEVAKRAELATSRIRYYEEIGLLPQPERRNGQRRYGSGVLERLSFIKAAQHLGFRLDEIKQLLWHQQEQTPLPLLWQQLAQAKLRQVDEHLRQVQAIRQLLQQSLHCECADLDSCIECVCAQC